MPKHADQEQEDIDLGFLIPVLNEEQIVIKNNKNSLEISPLINNSSALFADPSENQLGDVGYTTMSYDFNLEQDEMTQGGDLQEEDPLPFYNSNAQEEIDLDQDLILESDSKIFAQCDYELQKNIFSLILLEKKYTSILNNLFKIKEHQPKLLDLAEHIRELEKNYEHELNVDFKVILQQSDSIDSDDYLVEKFNDLAKQNEECSVAELDDRDSYAGTKEVHDAHLELALHHDIDVDQMHEDVGFEELKENFFIEMLDANNYISIVDNLFKDSVHLEHLLGLASYIEVLEKLSQINANNLNAVKPSHEKKHRRSSSISSVEMLNISLAKPSIDDDLSSVTDEPVMLVFSNIVRNPVKLTGEQEISRNDSFLGLDTPNFLHGIFNEGALITSSPNANTDTSLVEESNAQLKPQLTSKM